MLKCRKLSNYEHISRSQKRVAREKERVKLVIWISLQNHSQKLVIDEMKPYHEFEKLFCRCPSSGHKFGGTQHAGPIC